MTPGILEIQAPATRKRPGARPNLEGGSACSRLYPSLSLSKETCFSLAVFGKNLSIGGRVIGARNAGVGAPNSRAQVCRGDSTRITSTTTRTTTGSRTADVYARRVISDTTRLFVSLSPVFRDAPAAGTSHTPTRIGDSHLVSVRGMAANAVDTSGRCFHSSEDPNPARKVVGAVSTSAIREGVNLARRSA